MEELFHRELTKGVRPHRCAARCRGQVRECGRRPGLAGEVQLRLFDHDGRVGRASIGGVHCVPPARSVAREHKRPSGRVRPQQRIHHERRDVVVDRRRPARLPACLVALRGRQVLRTPLGFERLGITLEESRERGVLLSLVGGVEGIGRGSELEMLVGEGVVHLMGHGDALLRRERRAVGADEELLRLGVVEPEDGSAVEVHDRLDVVGVLGDQLQHLQRHAVALHAVEVEVPLVDGVELTDELGVGRHRDVEGCEPRQAAEL